MLPFVRMLEYGNQAAVPVGVKSVKVLQNNVFILLEDGRLYGRGHNYFYQLGNGSNTPTIVEEWVECLTDVKEFWTTANTQGMLVRKNDGTWWSTGTQSYRGVGMNYKVWTDVSDAFTVVNDTYLKIVIGINVTLVLTIDNKLYKMGYNSNGEVFTGAINQRVSVLTETPEVGVKDIGVTSNNAAFVLYTDGTLKYSGSPSAIGASGASAITSLTNVTTGVLNINQENQYSGNYILKSDGLYVCGSQIDGQLGDGVDGTINSLTTLKKIASSVIPSTATIDYIGGANYEAHIRAGGIWYFAGRSNAAGDGVVGTSVIKTWRACTNITEPSPYDSMTHGYMITFMIKNGELYGSGNGTKSGGMGTIPYAEENAGATGYFRKITIPT